MENKFAGVFSVKIAAIWILGAVCAFGFSWFLNLFLSSKDGISLWLAVLSAFVFLTFFLLQSLVIGSKNEAGLVVLFDCLALTVIFLVKNPMAISVLFLAIFLLFYYAASGGRKILDNSLRVDFWNVSRVVLSRSILSISLFVAAVFFVAISGSSKDFPFSPKIFEEIISSSQAITSKIIPGIDINAPLKEIVGRVAEQQLNTATEAQILPKAVQQQLVDQGVKEIYKQISGFTGQNINPDLKISQTLYDWAKAKFMQLTEGGRKAFYLVFGILLFVLIEGVSLPLRLLIAGFAFIIYQIMLALGYMHVSVEERSREVLIM